MRTLRAATGHDFSRYKETTLGRRLERRLQVLGLDSVADYLNLLRDDAAEPRRLMSELLINVTRFFRDADAFETLRREAIAPLANPSETVSVSPLAKPVASVPMRASTSTGRPSSMIDKSIRWMPVADSGPTGASVAESRQLSGGNARNLSWLKFASMTSGVPSSPALTRRASA